MTHSIFAMTTLLNGLWQGAILAATMALLLKLLPRLNSTTRFTVLWLTLLAVVALAAGPLTPDTSNPVERAGLVIVPLNSPVSAIPVSTEPVPKAGRHELIAGVSSSSSASVSKSKTDVASEWKSEPVQPNAVSRRLSSVMTALDRPLIRIRSKKTFGVIESLWALLSLIMLTRIGGGYWALRRLKLGAVPAPEQWQQRLKSLGRRNGVVRQTRLLVSTKIAAPVSLGFLNPAIVIPRPLFDTLSDSELELIVLHELAHLRRRDDWTNLAQKLIEALLPIQPALYWIGRRMSLERELACDDWVIAATGRAKPYAASLTRVAELSQWEHAGFLAAGAAGNRSQLFTRVHHMLDRTRNAAPKLALRPLGVAVIAVAALSYVGTRAPQMIAFAQNSEYDDSAAHFAARTAVLQTSGPQEAVAPSAQPFPAEPSTPVMPAAAASASSAPLARQAPAPPLAPMTPVAPATAVAPAAPVAPAAAAAPAELPAPAAPRAPIAPPAPMAPEASQEPRESHMNITSRNGWVSSNVKIDGAVEFTDDDRDVQSLSPGGRFHIEEGSWLSGRSYDVKADSSGSLTKTYSVGWSTKPLDDQGREWLGRFLPQLIRDSGMGAGPRVARIMRQGGPQAVISEIAMIRSDGSRRVYIEQLFSQAQLNSAQLKDAARLIKGISSDGDKAQAIIAVDQPYFTSELRPYIFEAAASISSDGDKRRVLSDIVKKDGANSETLVDAARAAKHISSDGDKAEVLIEMAAPYNASDELHMVYFEAVKTIASDGDHARVLSKLLEAHGGDPDTLPRVLRSAARISSDGDKARVLKEAVSQYREEETVRKAFFEAANSIASDGDRQQALVALTHQPGIAAPTQGEIANSAQRISSDGDKARVLEELTSINVDAIREVFFAAADSIHSDGDRSRVLMAAIDKPGTASATVIAAIQSAKGISSDGDMSRVLLDAASRYSADPSVSAALSKAVESLHSDGEYRTVMTEIARHGGAGASSVR